MSAGPKTYGASLARLRAGSPPVHFRPLRRSHPSAPSPQTVLPSELTSEHSLDWLLLTLREFALILNANGTVQSCWTSNHGFRRHAESVLLGRRLEDILDPGPMGQLSKMFQRALETGQNQDVPYSIRVAGELRSFLVRVVPVSEAAGGPPTICLTARDRTERIRHLELLEKSEALLEHAEQIASLGSWEFNLLTKDVALSPQLRQMYGLDPDAAWGEQDYWGRMHPQDRARAREIMERALADCQPFEYTSRSLASGLRVRTHFLRGLPLLVAGGKVVRIIGIVQDITERAQAEEELRRLSQQLLRARDDGHRHTARVLHESAGQTLAALKMTLARLREALPSQDRDAHDLLQSAAALADTAIGEVRTVSYLMHPPLLDEAGLSPALRWYAQGFSQRSGIAVAVDAPDDFGRCSQETETAVFRIVQEALTNVHRHSRSRTATIRLARQPGRLVAEVEDQGCGFHSTVRNGSQPKPYGVGIAGMRERVKLLNGRLEIRSDPGHGATVRVVLPDAPRLGPTRISDPDWSV